MGRGRGGEEEIQFEHHQISAAKILRRSIHTFLSYIHHFASTPAFLALPFSIAALLLPPSLSPLSLHHIHHRLSLLFSAANLTTPVYSLLCLKLSETLFSAAITAPFSLSFLLLAKSTVIQSLILPHPSRRRHHQQSPFFPLLFTHLLTSLLLLAAHSLSLTLLSLAVAATTAANLSSSSVTLLSAALASVYAVTLATAVVVSNLGLIVAGVERRGGVVAILKACVLLRGKMPTALALTAVMNVAMAGVEWLFRYRVVVGSFRGITPAWMVAGEGLLIGYLYSVLIVVDVMVGCFLYQRCIDVGVSMEFCQNCEEEDDPEEDVFVEYKSDLKKLKALEEGQGFSL